MSLFALFKPKGPEAVRKRLQKAETQFKRNDFNLARITVEDALQIPDCPEDLKTRLTELHGQCCDALTRYNLEMARSHTDAGDLEAALEFAKTATTFARSETNRTHAESILQEIEQQLDGGPFFMETSQGIVEEDVDETAYADLLLEGYPDFIRDEVQADDTLRHLMVCLNREDLEGAEEIVNMPASPATTYFQTVYHTLNGEPETALPLFRNLLDTHERVLDPMRIAEFIDLVRLAEAEDEVDELVTRHPEPEVFAAAARLAFARQDLDSAFELAQAGMDSMRADNFDPAMMAFTGILEFHRGRMKEAADLLESYRNMMASRGMLALPSEYALPLVTALEQTGRADEALEIGLHTVQAFGCPDTLAKCYSLAEQSSREDLRKLVSRLPKPGE